MYILFTYFSSYFVTMWHRNVFADFVVDFFQDFMTMHLRDFFTVRNGDLFRRFYRNFMTHGFSDNMTKWFWVTVMVSVVTFGLRFGLSLCFTFPSGMTSVTVCTIRIMPVRSISIRSGIIGIMGFGTNLKNERKELGYACILACIFLPVNRPNQTV